MGQQIFQKSVLTSQQSKFMTYYWGFILLLTYVNSSTFVLQCWKDGIHLLYWTGFLIWSCCNYDMVVFHLKLSWLPCSALRDVRIPPGPRLLILDHIRRCVDWFTVIWTIHQYSFLFWTMYCCQLFNTFRALIILPPRACELCLLQSLNIYWMVSMIFSNPDLGEAISSCKFVLLAIWMWALTLNRIVKVLDSMWVWLLYKWKDTYYWNNGDGNAKSLPG